MWNHASILVQIKHEQSHSSSHEILKISYIFAFIFRLSFPIKCFLIPFQYVVKCLNGLADSNLLQYDDAQIFIVNSCHD